MNIIFDKHAMNKKQSIRSCKSDKFIRVCVISRLQLLQVNQFRQLDPIIQSRLDANVNLLLDVTVPFFALPIGHHEQVGFIDSVEQEGKVG
jgi:hypothetical protein